MSSLLSLFSGYLQMRFSYVFRRLIIIGYRYLTITYSKKQGLIVSRALGTWWLEPPDFCRGGERGGRAKIKFQCQSKNLHFSVWTRHSNQLCFETNTKEFICSVIRLKSLHNEKLICEMYCYA